MSGCNNPEPYHPHSPDGTCPYWRVRGVGGIVHSEPVCTYWANEAWRANCEQTGIHQLRWRQEQERKRAMTDEARAEEDGRLF